MKTLTLATMFILSTLSFQAAEACTIKVKVKKSTAKTYYVGTATLSKKVREALKSQCTFDVSTFSKEELIKMETAKFNKKLKKLQEK